MAILGGPTHSGSRFSWKGNQAVAEASDLGRTGSEFGQIYDDACDIGFSILSHKTGEKITLYISNTIYHGRGEDREIGGWELKPTPESIRKVPGCKNILVTVFND